MQALIKVKILMIAFKGCMCLHRLFWSVTPKGRYKYIMLVEKKTLAPPTADQIRSVKYCAHEYVMGWFILNSACKPYNCT